MRVAIRSGPVGIGRVQTQQYSAKFRTTVSGTTVHVQVTVAVPPEPKTVSADVQLVAC